MSLLVALRCPLSSIMTFAAKEKTDRDVKRTRQEWEMHHARMAMEERAQKKENEETSV